MQFIVHRLPGKDGSISATHKGEEIFCPLFEISDGKVLSRKMSENKNFIRGKPITLSDIFEQVSYIANIPEIENDYIHVFLFEENQYAMGLLATEEPITNVRKYA